MHRSACLLKLLSVYTIATVGQALNLGRLLTDGDAALSKGHFTEAIKAYSSALEHDNTSTLILAKRGSAFLAQGNLKLALTDYNDAIEIDAQAFGTRLKRAKLFRRMGRLDEASADLERILKNKPSHKAGLKEKSVLGDLKALWQQIDKASQAKEIRRLLSRILDLSPACQTAKLRQAGILLQEQDYGGVILMTGQLLKQDPADASALLLRGRAYYQSGDLKVAKKHFSEALRSDPDHKSAKAWFKNIKLLINSINQAEESARSGNRTAAEENYLHAIGFQNLPEVLLSAFWFEVCKLRVETENARPAVDACTLVAEKDPENEEAIIHKVKALILDKQFGVAFQEASTAHRKFDSSRKIYEVYREAEMAQKMAERKQYYEILNISKSASHLDIKKAFRELARKWHPDKAAQEGITVEIAQQKFTDISEAYEILSDPEQRQAYDEGRDLQVGQGQGGGGYSQYNSHFAGFDRGFPSGGQQFFFRYG